MPKNDYQLDENTQTIGGLWESLYALAKGRVYDNNHNGGEYPLATREQQVRSARALVEAIEKTHEKMRREVNS